jgi:hypothetical protein
VLAEPFTRRCQTPINITMVRKAKREKPLTKVQVPGTEWLRVKTTEGNIFWTHKVNKTSLWEVPEEIQDIIQDLDWESLEANEPAKDEAPANAKRKVSPEQETAAEDSSGLAKRARLSPSPEQKDEELHELIIDQHPASVDSGDEDMREDEAQMKSSAPPKPQPQPVVELSASTDDTKPSDVTPASFNVPPQVNLSPEEARALFKVRPNNLHIGIASILKHLTDSTERGQSFSSGPILHYTPFPHQRSSLCPPIISVRTGNRLQRMVS